MIASLSTVFAHHGGFGLNLNPLDTNLINLVIVIGVLVWFLKGFLGGMLERRRQTILSELNDAEERLKSANAALAQAQQDLAAAQQKAEQIRADGKARAEAVRADSERRTIEDMARLKQDAVADLNAEAARVSDLLRREAARQAIEKALASLPGYALVALSTRFAPSTDPITTLVVALLPLAPALVLLHLLPLGPLLALDDRPLLASARRSLQLVRRRPGTVLVLAAVQLAVLGLAVGVQPLLGVALGLPLAICLGTAATLRLSREAGY